MTEIRFRREELYKAVWQEPLMRLAERYRISDVGLAKTCRKLNVPRPPRGYWQQLAAGKAPKKVPLPEAKPGLPLEYIYRIESSRPAKLQPAPVVVEKIDIPETLRGAHPKIREAKRRARELKPDDRGMLRLDKAGLLDVSVSKAQLDRAMRIYAAIVQAVEAEGRKLFRLMICVRALSMTRRC